jgi:hypothetical protein
MHRAEAARINSRRGLASAAWRQRSRRAGDDTIPVRPFLLLFGIQTH